MLERVQIRGFWEDRGRFAVLDGAEVRDRIEAGLGIALSLLERLRGLRGERRRRPTSAASRAAGAAALGGGAAVAAGEPADALLGVEGETEFAVRLACRPHVGARARHAARGAPGRRERAGAACPASPELLGRRRACTSSRSPARTARASASASG